MSEYVQRLAQIRENNPEQWKALCFEKSQVVIAGPGAGKTYLLTMKVAKLLLEQVPSPRGVACLTYSRLMARQLKARFEKLAIPNSSRLFVGTVHSFCLAEVVQPYRHLYPEIDFPVPFRIASKDERMAAAKQALLEQEKHGDKEWLEKVLRRLDCYRRQHPNFESIYSMGIDWSRLANRFTSVLLQGKEPSLDFVHLEVVALRMIEKYAFVRKALEARYPWWAIDEYQDLGHPFHKIVCAMLKFTDTEVFAIGDPDQCIYETLSGTSPLYIGQLAQQIHSKNGQEPIRLLRNYRCANELIRASEIILGETRGYQSNDNGGICVCIDCRGGQAAQHQVMLKELLPKLANVFDTSGLSLDQMAILHRNRKTRNGEGLNPIADHLDQWPYSLDKDPEYDNVSEVVEWIEMLALWCSNGEVLFDDLIPFWINLNTDCNMRRPSGICFGLEVRLFEIILKLRDPKTNLADWFSSIVDKLQLTPLLENFRRSRPDDVVEFDRLKAALQQGHRLNTWSLEKFAKGPNRIQLTTLHSSKGTEFDTVIIAGGERLSQIDRRLAYVGITRARKRVYILYCGRSFFVEQLKRNSPEGCKFVTRVLD